MWRALFLSSAFLGLGSAVLAETYVVNPEGTGDFRTIQVAVNVAQDGDVIELTDGTFTGDWNRDIRYCGKAITVRSQSGDPHSCIIDCEGTESDPHRGFIWRDGEGSDSVLEAVTVTGGCETFGGAAFLLCSSPTISSCVFRNNYGRSGGAIDCDEESAPTIIGCTFADNRAASGGAICI
jgi:predicted outer membrane repeat protein